MENTGFPGGERRVLTWPGLLGQFTPQEENINRLFQLIFSTTNVHHFTMVLYALDVALQNYFHEEPLPDPGFANEAVRRLWARIIYDVRQLHDSWQIMVVMRSHRSPRYYNYRPGAADQATAQYGYHQYQPRRNPDVRHDVSRNNNILGRPPLPPHHHQHWPVTGTGTGTRTGDAVRRPAHEQPQPPRSATEVAGAGIDDVLTGHQVGRSAREGLREDRRTRTDGRQVNVPPGSAAEVAGASIDNVPTGHQAESSAGEWFPEDRQQHGRTQTHGLKDNVPPGWAGEVAGAGIDDVLTRRQAGRGAREGFREDRAPDGRTRTDGRPNNVPPGSVAEVAGAGIDDVPTGQQAERGAGEGLPEDPPQDGRTEGRTQTDGRQTDVPPGSAAEVAGSGIDDVPTGHQAGRGAGEGLPKDRLQDGRRQTDN